MISDQKPIFMSWPVVSNHKLVYVNKCKIKQSTLELPFTEMKLEKSEIFILVQQLVTSRLIFIQPVEEMFEKVSVVLVKIGHTTLVNYGTMIPVESFTILIIQVWPVAQNVITLQISLLKMLVQVIVFIK